MMMWVPLSQCLLDWQGIALHCQQFRKFRKIVRQDTGTTIIDHERMWPAAISELSPYLEKSEEYMARSTFLWSIVLPSGNVPFHTYYLRHVADSVGVPVLERTGRRCFLGLEVGIVIAVAHELEGLGQPTAAVGACAAAGVGAPFASEQVTLGLSQADLEAGAGHQGHHGHLHPAHTRVSTHLQNKT